MKSKLEKHVRLAATTIKFNKAKAELVVDVMGTVGKTSKAAKMAKRIEKLALELTCELERAYLKACTPEEVKRGGHSIHWF